MCTTLDPNMQQFDLLLDDTENINLDSQSLTPMSKLHHL